MSLVSFENYGRMASALPDCTVIAGRYAQQRAAERAILFDVAHKLALRGEDRCLEIGCNVGNLLIPLSFLVESITGVDHPACIERLQRRFMEGSNIPLRAGDFMDLRFEERYDKILIYSVLHYLRDEEEVFAFVEKAVALLAPGGKALLGDLPNTSRKRRFLDSAQGQQFQAKWQAQRAASIADSAGTTLNGLPADPELVVFDDRLILALIGHTRALGCHAYVLPQPPELPFGHTREDILIERTS